MRDRFLKPWAFFVKGVKKWGFKRYLVVAGLCLTVVLFFVGYFRSLENSGALDHGLLLDGLQGAGGGDTDTTRGTNEKGNGASYLMVDSGERSGGTSLSGDGDMNVSTSQEGAGGSEISEMGGMALKGTSLNESGNVRPLPYVDLGTIVMPVSGRLSAGFGWRKNPIYGDWRYYPGIDIEAPPGALVLAAFGGRVKDVERNGLDSMVITLEHGGGITTIYSGVAVPLVQPGELVEGGQAIAKMKEGTVSNKPLYFQVSTGEDFVDPARYLK